MPRPPTGPLTTERFRLAQAMVEETYAALKRGEGVCVLCRKRPAAFLVETRLTPEQAKRAGMTERKYAFVQQGVCKECRAEPDVESRIDADIERTLGQTNVERYDLGDLPWPDTKEFFD